MLRDSGFPTTFSHILPLIDVGTPCHHSFRNSRFLCTTFQSGRICFSQMCITSSARFSRASRRSSAAFLFCFSAENNVARSTREKLRSIHNQTEKCRRSVHLNSTERKKATQEASRRTESKLTDSSALLHHSLPICHMLQILRLRLRGQISRSRLADDLIQCAGSYRPR